MPNNEKAKVRQKFAAGEVDRDELMAAEMAAYHGPGTCTFYGTANTNQMLMEFMGCTCQAPVLSPLGPSAHRVDARRRKACSGAQRLWQQLHTHL